MIGDLFDNGRLTAAFYAVALAIPLVLAADKYMNAQGEAGFLPDHQKAVPTQTFVARGSCKGATLENGGKDDFVTFILPRGCALEKHQR